MPLRRAAFWIGLSVVYILAVSTGALAQGVWAALALISPCGLVLVFGALPMLYKLASHSITPAGIRLAHYHCGSCDYDLRGLEPEPDGCRICPECNAAWRLWPRCRACGGTLTDEPLKTKGWYECLTCGECWRLPSPPAAASSTPPGSTQGDDEAAAGAAPRSGDHLSQSSSTAPASVK